MKIERAAKKAKKTPAVFVKEISQGFKDLCKTLHISYDDFIMTTDDRHKKVATAIVSALHKKGDIYKGIYKGHYCVDCETYYTEKDLINKKDCPTHKKPAEFIEEESYFFKLSKYKKDVINAFNKGHLWPDKKTHEMINRLDDELKDLSISRDKVTWGIPLPFDKDKVIFVWVEALINYLSSVDYPNKKYKTYWPAVHVIGPDIVWHHTVIWFSLLKALGVKLPHVVVHGFINLKGEKLSKARGITVDPIKLSETYGTDALRYFLLREIPFGDDGDFTEDALKTRLNNELANDLGNLLSRSLSIVDKNLNGRISKKPTNKQLSKTLNLKQIEKHMDNYALHHALEEIWAFIKEVNKYINDTEPWKADNKEELLYNVLDSTRIIAILLRPFLPETSDAIFSQLNIKPQTLTDAQFGLYKGGKINKGKHLFSKI